MERGQQATGQQRQWLWQWQPAEQSKPQLKSQMFTVCACVRVCACVCVHEMKMMWKLGNWECVARFSAVAHIKISDASGNTTKYLSVSRVFVCAGSALSASLSLTALYFSHSYSLSLPLSVLHPLLLHLSRFISAVLSLPPLFLSPFTAFAFALACSCCFSLRSLIRISFRFDFFLSLLWSPSLYSLFLFLPSVGISNCCC